MPSPRLEAGKLRHRIDVLKSNLTQDSFGGWKIGDASLYVANLPAAIDTLTGRELYAAQQKVSQVTHKITVRWYAGIKAKMNVHWYDERDKFFQIQAVENPDGRHKMLVLLCLERDDSARAA